MELIDKAAVVAEIEKLYAYFYSLHEQRIIEKILSIINTIEVKDVNDAYKQGYNDAIDKFCKFMQSCEGYVVSGNKCNYDNFIKYMEEQQ